MELNEMNAKRLIEALARKHELLHADGTVNASAFSRRSKIPQPTISRITGGRVSTIAPSTFGQLMKAFNKTRAELEELERSEPGRLAVAEPTKGRTVEKSVTPVTVDSDLLSAILHEVLDVAAQLGVSIDRRKVADIAALIYSDVAANRTDGAVVPATVSRDNVTRLVRLAS